jgi:hypothetical protein
MYKHAKAKPVSIEISDVAVVDRASVAPRSGTDFSERDLSWFAERVERGRKEPFPEIITITPDIAKRLMETNEDNRNIRAAKVNRIYRDIISGHFDMNGESIVISVEGLLNDGQHRLLAIIKADRPVQCVVVFGVTRQSRMTVDQGDARYTSTFLAMDGITSASNCSATASLYYNYSIGYYGQASKDYRSMVTRQDVRDFYYKNKTIIDRAVFLTSSKFKLFGPTASSAAAYCIIKRADSIYADGFFEMLITGANLDPPDPVLWLRNRLVTHDLKTWERLEAWLRYWIAWKDKRQLRQHIKLMGNYPTIVENISSEE